MDSLITIIVIVALTALSSWLKKKGLVQDEETWGEEPGPRPPATPSESPPPQTRPPVSRPKPAGPVDWERQLRRLLEGDLPSEPSAPPPPVLEPQRPPPSPRIPLPPVVTAGAEPPASTLGRLPQSSGGYEKARHLHVTVAERLAEIKTQTEQRRLKLEREAPRSVSVEVRELVSSLGQPRAARQAMLASFIFGPPKSLEGS